MWLIHTYVHHNRHRKQVLDRDWPITVAGRFPFPVRLISVRLALEAEALSSDAFFKNSSRRSGLSNHMRGKCRDLLIVFGAHPYIL